MDPEKQRAIARAARAFLTRSEASQNPILRPGQGARAVKAWIRLRASRAIMLASEAGRKADARTEAAPKTQRAIWERRNLPQRFEGAISE
jgi:hypothetical protein